MGKAVFPEKPAVRPLAGTDYVLEEDFYFPAKVGEWDVVVHVKPGFRTDGASIPRWLWPVFGSPYDPDIMAAAIGHDAMYRGRIVPRADADAAFRSMMKANGIARWKRRRIWIGVRFFGWITWLRHTPESVAEARRHIELAFGSQSDFSPSGPPGNRLDRYKGLSYNNQIRLRPGGLRRDKPKKGKDKMKKLIVAMFENGTLQLLALGVALAALFAAAGCKSIEVEYRGKALATWTDTNGVVRAICDDIGKPIFFDKGWIVDYFQHGVMTKFDELHAEAGPGAKLDLNGYKSDVSSNFVALVSASFDGGARLATAIGDAYVKIAGGGAQASTVLTSTKKVLAYFKSLGGDVSKASVTSDGTLLKVSDGSTCVSCDAEGNCAACSE